MFKLKNKQQINRSGRRKHSPQYEDEQWSIFILPNMLAEIHDKNLKHYELTLKSFTIHILPSGMCPLKKQLHIK